ncbi:hypothetical protein HanXRQr2_Chr15g0713541 [Helianthus annuus]|uniref:Uncharacterized protein n=1 Tax=Helianthus annuus TaxID=4232 RepID=A0A9K3E581_HELAN|nr:hypothetical protein HanXRQr2_Chr15g0713541 [Helianthus annuus]KAJ0832962.1 hypothetical protein HanPSC8_Chr15g0684741 [Helianthus annuus]
MVVYAIYNLVLLSKKVSRVTCCLYGFCFVACKGIGSTFTSFSLCHSYNG